MKKTKSKALQGAKLQKASGAIHIKGYVDMNPRKLWDLFLYQAFPTLANATFFYIDTDLVLECFEYSRGNLGAIRGYMEDLMTKLATFNATKKDKSSNWDEACTLLSGAKFVQKNARIRYSFDPILKEWLLSSEMYSEVMLMIGFQLKRKGALPLYQAGVDYLGVGITPDYEFDDLKENWSIEASAYTNKATGETKFKALNQWAISPVLEEVNEKTDLNFTPVKRYKDNKVGGKVVKIAFAVQSKNDQEEKRKKEARIALSKYTDSNTINRWMKEFSLDHIEEHLQRLHDEIERKAQKNETIPRPGGWLNRSINRKYTQYEIPQGEKKPSAKGKNKHTSKSLDQADTLRRLDSAYTDYIKEKTAQAYQSLTETEQRDLLQQYAEHLESRKDQKPESVYYRQFQKNDLGDPSVKANFRIFQRDTLLPEEERNFILWVKKQYGHTVKKKEDGMYELVEGSK